MQPLTAQGQQRINEIANQYNVSSDAVLTLLQALVNGHGTMAQFSHPDLGGSGQWMQGGMTMVGDMFNNSLKAKVDGLCYELSNLLAQQPFRVTPTNFQSQNQGGGQQQGGGYSTGNVGNSTVSLFVPEDSGDWWPSGLGSPSSSGSQNNIRYAYFPSTHRLAIEINGEVSVYDTLDHQIGGISQQQGLGASVIFTSQYGTVDVLNLPIISGPGTIKNQPTMATSSSNSSSEVDIFGKIEKLAQLKQQGILSEQEFTTKKAELLSRL